MLYYRFFHCLCDIWPLFLWSIVFFLSFLYIFQFQLIFWYFVVYATPLLLHCGMVVLSNNLFSRNRPLLNYAGSQLRNADFVKLQAAVAYSFLFKTLRALLQSSVHEVSVISLKPYSLPLCNFYSSFLCSLLVIFSFKSTLN
jgi:hypothetical protein